MGSNKSNKKIKPTNLGKVAVRSQLVQEVSKKSSIRLYDNKTLKTVLQHLSKRKRRKLQVPAKETCPTEDSTEARTDHQVKLRCRQLTTVVQELRRAVMRQDWDEVTTLLLILCHPGLKYYSSIILRTCFILLCNHPNSNLQLVKNFIRHMTHYILEEDVNKFLRILFVLRKSGLNSIERGKFPRKNGDYKITRDPEFEML